MVPNIVIELGLHALPQLGWLHRTILTQPIARGHSHKTSAEAMANSTTATVANEEICVAVVLQMNLAAHHARCVELDFIIGRWLGVIAILLLLRCHQLVAENEAGLHITPGNLRKGHLAEWTRVLHLRPLCNAIDVIAMLALCSAAAFHRYERGAVVGNGAEAYSALRYRDGLHCPVVAILWCSALSHTSKSRGLGQCLVEGRVLVEVIAAVEAVDVQRPLERRYAATFEASRGHCATNGGLVKRDSIAIFAPRYTARCLVVGHQPKSL